MKTTDEVAWQQAWSDANVFASTDDASKPKFYCLEMYPYPSGKMHMGHVRNYSIGDAVARYKRMKGFNVLYPMGFDSFGMPAENAAIAEGCHPHDITEKNMASITEQIKRMGFSTTIGVVCSRAMIRIITNGTNCSSLDSSNQALHIVNLLQSIGVNPVRLFLPMNKSRRVDVGVATGPVRQKDMSQWFIDITKYAQQLLDGLNTIEFPESVRLMQEDWLGRSEGAEIEFGIEGSEKPFVPLQHDQTHCLVSPSSHLHQNIHSLKNWSKGPNTKLVGRQCMMSMRT